jgi:type VI secretion system protein VasD
VNPDAQGRPLPTVVQVLQLASVTGFEGKDFAEIYRGPKDALGDDLVKVDELLVDPGQGLSRWVPRDPKTKFLAAVGVFRMPSGTTWKSVYAVPAAYESECKPQQGERKGPPNKRDEAFSFSLEDYRISSSTPPNPNAGKGK